MDIGKYQKLLIETNNNIYEEYIKNSQYYYDSIIFSAYESLTGKQLDTNRYTSPWLLKNNITVNRDTSAVNDTVSDHDKIIDYTHGFTDG